MYSSFNELSEVDIGVNEIPYQDGTPDTLKEELIKSVLDNQQEQIKFLNAEI